MNDLEKALKAESDNKLVEAAEHYEKIIASNPKPPLDVFINLMFLYAETQDYGIVTEQDLSVDYIDKAYDRITPLYQQAKALYPESVELDFWENYIFYRYPYGPEYEKIDERFFHQDKDTIPYFFAHSYRTGAYVKEAKEIWEMVKDGKTFKERYIRGWVRPPTPRDLIRMRQGLEDL